jgi:Uma2 family endonuclease
MSAVPLPKLTPAEYLAMERSAERKSEYFAGEVFAMAGASREHNLVVGNIVRLLGQQLRGRRCEVYPSDMRVKVSATGLYTYPDVVAIYGEPEFEDDELDTLLSPTLVVEVLSQSTEAYDRGAKSAHYRRLESLEEYVLVAQSLCRVEHYLRQPDGAWTLREHGDLQAILSLPAVRCELPLAEVYDKVEFPPTPPLRLATGASR